MSETQIRQSVREAYMLSDMRFQVVELLVDHFELDSVISLLIELGGMRIKKSEVVYPGYLSLGPVFRRTLGGQWDTAFEIVGADVFTLPTANEYIEKEKDVEAYCLVSYATSLSRKWTLDEKIRADRVRLFLTQAGLGDVSVVSEDCQ